MTDDQEWRAEEMWRYAIVDTVEEIAKSLHVSVEEVRRVLSERGYDLKDNS